MYVLYIVVCPFVLFLLAIVLSVLLRCTDSDYLPLYLQTLLIANCTKWSPQLVKLIVLTVKFGKKKLSWPDVAKVMVELFAKSWWTTGMYSCNSIYSLKHVLIDYVDVADDRPTFYNVNNLYDLLTKYYNGFDVNIRSRSWYVLLYILTVQEYAMLHIFISLMLHNSSLDW